MKFFIFSILQLCVNNKLLFNSDGQFKILQFTDIHFGESYEQDLLTQNVMQNLIQIEKPDICVITGDMVSGYAWDGEHGWQRHMYERWKKVFIQNQQKYMMVMGNHDSQADLNRYLTTLLDVDTNPYSLTKMNQQQLGNYYHSVYHENQIVLNIWAFDSQDENCEENLGWGCISALSVDWYEQESLIQKNLYNNKSISGIAFFHIPLIEYKDMWNSNQTIRGIFDEEISCSAKNTGLFQALLKHNNIQNVFCGHDHKNDFYGQINHIGLYFGRKTGQIYQVSIMNYQSQLN